MPRGQWNPRKAGQISFQFKTFAQDALIFYIGKVPLDSRLSRIATTYIFLGCPLIVSPRALVTGSEYARPEI